MASQDYIFKNVRTAAILTGSYVAGTVLENAHNYNQLVVLVSFTIGSLTTAEIKVEFSPDNSTWYQETFGSVSSGTDTLTVGEHSIGATGKFRIPVAIKDRYIRISAKGTGTATSSTMTIDAALGNV